MNGRRGRELRVNPKTMAGRDINTGYPTRNEGDKDCEVRKLISVYANISRGQTAFRDSIIKFLGREKTYVERRERKRERHSYLGKRSTNEFGMKKFHA